MATRHQVHQRRKKWIRSFVTYASAAGCTDKKQQRQLLLHSAVPEVQDIFDTLTDTGDDIDKAKKKLLEYFTPLQNIPFNRHVFRQEAQSDTETVTQFLTRLRRLAVSCNFGDAADDFICHQVIDKSKSKSLHTKFLAERDLTLNKVMEISTAKEASESRSAQFDDVDRTFTVNKQKKYKKQQNKSQDGEHSKKLNKGIKCYRCGQIGHAGNEVSLLKSVSNVLNVAKLDI